jgi:hypothetical protein
VLISSRRKGLFSLTIALLGPADPGAAGQEDPLDVGLERGVEDVERPLDVHLVAEPRVLGRLAGVGQGGKMEDELEAVQGGAEVLADVEAQPGDVLDGRADVEDGDLVAGRDELPDEVGADEPRPSGDADLHSVPPGPRRADALTASS